MAYSSGLFPGFIHPKRSDHFCFCKKKIPGMFLAVGTDSIDHSKEWTRSQIDKWTANCYHKPADIIDSSWDLSGAIDDLRLIFRMGYALAQEKTFPKML